MSTQQQPASLALRDLTLRFGGLTVLDRVSLDIAPGEVIGLIGPNGAGKSALVNCITGVYRPEAGSTIRVAGHEITHEPSYRRGRRGVSRTFQHLELLPSLTAVENVGVGFSNRRSQGLARRLLRPLRTVREDAALSVRAHAALALAGAAHVADALPGSLSLGQQRRVDLARALISHPSVLLLDEPASGMSHQERDDIVALVRDARTGDAAAARPAVLWIEHDIALILSVADRVAVLHHGRLVLVERTGTDAARQRIVTAYMTGEVDASGGVAQG